MKQIINSNNYSDWPNIEVNYKKKIELFVDDFYLFDETSETFKIFYLNEVIGVGRIKNYLINNYYHFDAIITHHPDILEKCPNSYFLPRGTSWLKDFKIYDKSFSVSNLVGEKTISKGHVLRQKIHYKQNRIKIPKRFFVGNRPNCPEIFENNLTLQNDTSPLYDSQFNIVIENVKQNNWFTEKLIDCFLKKTIPIYWGCDNIGDFFDINGFYIVNNFKEIIDVCNSLDENSYMEKISFLDKNFELCQKYITITDRFENVVNKILTDNGNI